jgi:lipoprotein-anchoring transpeptidase ErfK/SrfK
MVPVEPLAAATESVTFQSTELGNSVRPELSDERAIKTAAAAPVRSDPGYATVRQEIPVLLAYSEPALDAAESYALANPGPFDGIRTLQTTGEEKGQFIEVILPRIPNGTRAWVIASEVIVKHTDTAIVIDLSDRTAQLFIGSRLLLTAPVAVGKEATPTPRMEAIIDVSWHRYESSITFGPFYGDHLFGLNQHSEVLTTFAGGRPAIAIHGTSKPELIGLSVSNGCVRMKAHDIARFGEHVTLGTVVRIVD